MAERRRPVIWSSDARTDLAGIWDYYARVAGLHTAEKMIREIGEACRILKDHPFAGRSRNEVRPALRSVVANPHVIFYRVKTDVAEIVRVLDGRQDIDTKFSDADDSHNQ
jgi:toxin ParE1/3/4